MASKHICLISTIHDPKGKLFLPAFHYLPALDQIYDSIIISVTDQTNQIVKDVTNGNISPTQGMAMGRRRVLQLGLATQADVFHYCDFDRILYWVAHFPKELKELIKIVRSNDDLGKFLVLERTQWAFDTHPLLQRLTEGLVNKYHSNGRYTDYLSGSRIIPRDLATQILDKSQVNNGAALDVEWVKLLDPDNVSHFAFNGLAYEHKFLGLEKSFKQEVATRLDNMISALRLNVTR